MVSSSLCFKFLIISTLRYWTHLKFIVLQLCFCFREQSHLLNNSFFSSGLKFTPLHIEFLCVLGSVSGISVLVHGPATATLWRHSWKASCLLVLSYVSGHSISAPPLAGPPALPTPPPPQLLYHGTLSCSQADLIQLHGFKHQLCMDGISFISLAQTSPLISRLM